MRPAYKPPGSLALPKAVYLEYERILLEGYKTLSRAPFSLRLIPLLLTASISIRTDRISRFRVFGNLLISSSTVFGSNIVLLRHKALPDLISALAAHPAFLIQSASRKGKIYYLRDFAT